MQVFLNGTAIQINVPFETSSSLVDILSRDVRWCTIHLRASKGLRSVFF